ncbi:ABC transporter permease [Georgenia sp. Z1491]|uniref:ABC transporter permease n=1 Tax=Georgenia sp. Z1491 TaxID=3416707 RepID=UPI003CF4F6F8
MRAILTVAGTELRRFLRDRSNIFFVFVFPLLLVLVLGSQFGGSGSQGGVTISGDGGELQDEVVTVLEDHDLTVDTDKAEAARTAVARGRTDVALVVPDDAEAAWADGEPVTLEVVAGSAGNSVAVQQRVSTAVESLSLDRIQLDALVSAGADPAQADDELAAAREAGGAPEVVVTDVDEIAQEFSGLGQFDLGGVSQLLLFVFLISLAASGTLIQARRNGVVARSLSAPIRTQQMMGGLTLGRWVIAMFQGVYIMAATALLFGVDWGNLALAGLVLAVFAAVAAGVAMLLGSLLDNEGAASGVGVGLGLVLAGIGGGMAPLEIFPDTMRQVAHVTPHAWAYDAFAEIQRHDGSLVDILPMLGVLAGMALLAVLLGTWAMRRSLARSL